MHLSVLVNEHHAIGHLVIANVHTVRANPLSHLHRNRNSQRRFTAWPLNWHVQKRVPRNPQVLCFGLRGLVQELATEPCDRSDCRSDLEDRFGKIRFHIFNMARTWDELVMDVGRKNQVLWLFVRDALKTNQFNQKSVSKESVAVTKKNLLPPYGTSGSSPVYLSHLSEIVGMQAGWARHHTCTSGRCSRESDSWDLQGGQWNHGGPCNARTPVRRGGEGHPAKFAATMPRANVPLRPMGHTSFLVWNTMSTIALYTREDCCTRLKPCPVSRYWYG